jgi:hypothetical protein
MPVEKLSAAARGGVILLCAVVAVVGCSTGGTGGSEAPFERPGWMAEQSQRQAEYREALQACAAAKGWNVTIDTGGGVVEPFDDVDFPRWEADRDGCRSEMGLDDVSSSISRERARLVYARQVDTWRCVSELGHDVSAPPSEEAFVEELSGSGGEDARGATAWGPYGDLPVLLTDGEMSALADECPEPWWAD